MAEKEYFPKVTADSIDTFNHIAAKLNTLPKATLCDIERAELGLVGIKCTFKNNFKTERKYHLPNNTTQIQEFDNHIGIYAGDFYFEIIKEHIKSAKVGYVLIDQV